jgi:hypothetical protein
MPITALAQLENAEQIPRCFSVDTDELERFGVERNSELEFIPYECEKPRRRLFLLWIRGTTRYLVTRFCCPDCLEPGYTLEIDGKRYRTDDLKLVGELAKKRQPLRLVG